MHALAKKIIVVPLLALTLSFLPGRARAGSPPNLDFSGDSSEAGAAVIALSAVGAAALIGTVVWLIASSGWEDDLAAEVAAVADEAEAEGADASTREAGIARAGSTAR